MEKNVGGMDRNVRLVVGVVLLVIGIVGIAPGMGIFQMGSLVVGIILVGTGALQYCPINQAIGRNTFKA
jgi:uncharacterized membrane protein HdeD (DUF308 family)